MKRHYRLYAFMLIIGALGCSSMGNNMSFSLLYKRDVLRYYENNQRSNLEKLRSGSTNSLDLEKAIVDQNALIADMNAFLPTIYDSALPFLISDQYDSRGKKSIRMGEPLNIIINKIHLKDKGELLWFDTGEIAVVVTVDDGKSEKPQSVLVSYDEGIISKTDLPIQSLLAYSTDSYGGEPIRIEISVLELDGKEIESYKALLDEGARIGASLAAVDAGGLSLAAQMGTFLLSKKKDDVLVKLTFQLYPADPTKGKPSQSFGIPRVSLGSYIIFCRREDDVQPKIVDNIQVGYDHVPYLLSNVTNSGQQDRLRLSVVNDILSKTTTTVQQITARQWPDMVSRPLETNVEMSYAIFTVDNTPIVDARKIVSRANKINRLAAGLKDLGDITPSSIDAVLSNIDALKSALRLSAVVGNYVKVQKDVDALQTLFDAYSKEPLIGSDKMALLTTIQSALPESKTVSYAGNKEALERWYKANKANLYYDADAKKYCLTDADKKVCQ